MKAKLIQEKSFEKYERKHAILEFQKILESFKTPYNIDKILEKRWLNPDNCKSIQTPEWAEYNILTFSDEYIENLKKFANK